MNGNPPLAQDTVEDIGAELYSFAERLFPICRSITGDGVRETLAQVQALIPLTIHEVPSGTEVFDWTVPPEWNIRDAWVKDASGRRVIDFKQNNLHVVSYSNPVRTQMSLEDLRPHLFTHPEQHDLIPYRTAYYASTWGFCLSQQTLDALPDGDYEVCVDATLEPGSLSYGELLIPGRSEEEVLLSCHVCHPSLANDNLSGIAVAAYLAREMLQQNQSKPLRFSYRFLFVPATIGSLTWLSRNRGKISRIRHGLSLACLGDSGPFTYKRSRRGNAEIDSVVTELLERQGPHEILDFSPYGYDERQYCSPGFDLPLGRLTRTPHGAYPEYHTSGDNMMLISAEHLAQSLALCMEILSGLETNRVYLNLKPYGEPQLGKYGLYDLMGGSSAAPESRMALLWVLNLSDGQHSLLHIAHRSGIQIQALATAADALVSAGLLREINEAGVSA